MSNTTLTTVSDDSGISDRAPPTLDLLDGGSSLEATSIRLSIAEGEEDRERERLNRIYFFVSERSLPT